MSFDNKAEVCKAPYTGSIPVRASKIPTGDVTENKGSSQNLSASPVHCKSGLDTPNSGRITAQSDSNPTQAKTQGRKRPRPIRIIGTGG